MKRRTYKLETNFIDCGGEKRLLVFVHGMSGGAWIWDNFTAFFSAAGYSCLTFSVRGHGGSEGAGAFTGVLHSFDSYVRDLELVLSEYAGRKPVLIGHSMGGAVVQRYIELHPEEASAAVLLASVPRYPGNPRRACRRSIALKLLGSSNLSMTLFAVFGIRRISGLVKTSFCAHLDRDAAENFALKMCRESLPAALRIAFGRLYGETSYSGKIPVMVAGGGLDYLFGLDEFKATAEYYGTEAVIFPEMCHEMAIAPNWREAAEAVSGFLQSLC
ncbi:MAG: alpha/beta hydrolase [Oscillospiraceae bacterium]|jgi:pimeloyl-ACP methyl ester carboxylesterase|nr:alpha/beta hydrolase [Oscillospiraceae bacterium]